MAKKAKKFRSSVRNISTALLVVGVLAVSGSTGLLLATVCPSSEQCLATAVVFGIPAYVVEDVETGRLSGSTAETPPLSPNEPSMLHEILVIMQATGVYLIFIAVIILIVLESMELYYLRRLVGKRKFAWR